jgi:class 3 adenylate cyclase
VFDEELGRDLLLRDLPPRLTDLIERSSAKRVDLDHIIAACDRADGATQPPPLAQLVDNAVDLVDGTDLAAQLRVFRDHLLAAPPLTTTPLPEEASPPPAASLPTGTVTFLFTDIEGSTQRWEHDPAAMKAALARHDLLVRAAITAHNGQVFQTAGDSFAAAFVTAPAAMAAAMAAQQALQAEPWPASVAPLRVRMALHTGLAEFRADGWHAEYTLNRLARLLSAGSGGQVLLTDVTRELLREDLPKDVTLRDLGEYRLLNQPSTRVPATGS